MHTRSKFYGYYVLGIFFMFFYRPGILKHINMKHLAMIVSLIIVFIAVSWKNQFLLHHRQFWFIRSKCYGKFRPSGNVSPWIYYIIRLFPIWFRDWHLLLHSHLPKTTRRYIMNMDSTISEACLPTCPISSVTHSTRR